VSPAERIAIVAALTLVYSALGAGVMVHLQIAPTGADLVRRGLLAPAIGLTCAGILVATAATLGLIIGPWVLAGIAGVAAVTAAARVRRLPAPEPPPRAGLVVWAVVGLVVGWIGWRLVTTPLASFDGSMMWAYKIQALFEFGTPANPAFVPAIAPHVHPEYPLLYPELQATAVRLAGTMDEPLLRLHAFALHVLLALAAYGLLRDRVRRALAGAAVAAVAFPSFVIGNVGDLYVDAILGWLVALAVLAAARWVEEDRPWLLVVATIFAAGAMLTKNEGLLGVVALAVGLAVATWRSGRWRPLAAAGVIVVLAYLPWRIYRSIHGLGDADFDLANLAHPAFVSHRSGRVPGILVTIAERVVLGWPVVTAAALLALWFVVADRRVSLARLTVAWGLTLITGLTASYLLTVLVPGARLTANVERTILQLVFASALLAAYGLGTAAREGGR
jgi:hypothetical protein